MRDKVAPNAANAHGNKVHKKTDNVNPDNDLPGFYQNAPQGEPRGSVNFNVPDAYALITFFKAADPSTVPHEMYHVFRRMMADTWADPNASPEAKERYRKACEFVGAKPGEKWTVAQEEKFAQAGERFLLEGVSPHPSMDDVMDSFKQWMTEIYISAEKSGLEISNGSARCFQT